MIKNTKYWKDLTQEEAENLIYEPEFKSIRVSLRDWYEEGFYESMEYYLGQWFECFESGDIKAMELFKNQIICGLNLNTYLLDGSWADECGKDFMITTELSVSVNQIGKEV